MMVAIPNLDSAAPAANDNKPMPPNERAAFISMIQEKAALNRPVAVADDSIDAETLLAGC
jgi:hypothetical protein